MIKTNDLMFKDFSHYEHLKKKKILSLSVRKYFYRLLLLVRMGHRPIKLIHPWCVLPYE